MKRKHYAIPYGVFLVAFVIVPILLILYNAFIDRDTGNFTFGNFKIFTENYALLYIWQTLWMGVVSTAICLAIGYPLAYVLSTIKFKHKSLLVMLLLLPMWVNFLIRTLATQGILKLIGMEENYSFAVIFGLVYNFLPFMVLPIYTFLSKMDNKLLDASSDLGAKGYQTFYKVTLPLSMPSVISGIIMVFMPMISTFAITDILSYRNIKFLGNLISDQFLTANDRGVGSALSLLLLTVVVVSMLFNKKETTKGENL